MANASLRQVAQAAMAIADRLQSYPQSTQVLAGGAFIVLLAKRLDVDVAVLFEYLNNLIHTADGRRPEFNAVSDYLTYHLKEIV